MSERWLALFNGPPGLKELCVEYETIAWKKNQLDAIVARNKNWKLALQDGNHLSAEGTKLSEWKWMGPSKLGGRSWRHHGDTDTVEYVVVVDRWILKDGHMPAEDKAKRIDRFGAVDGDDDLDDGSDDMDDGHEDGSEDGSEDEEQSGDESSGSEWMP